MQWDGEGDILYILLISCVSFCLYLYLCLVSCVLCLVSAEAGAIHIPTYLHT